LLLGIPQIPEQVLSTYELPIEEIVSSGPNRLIVFEGAEERVTQLTVGLLERLAWQSPGSDEEEAYLSPTTTRAENQLGTGVPLRTPMTQPRRTPEPVIQGNWDEDNGNNRSLNLCLSASGSWNRFNTKKR